MLIEVFTDGSATVASKPGGYGWVLCVDGTKIDEGNGHMTRATNNDAEMEAAIHGLAAVLKYIDRRRQMLAASGAEQEQIDRLTKAEVILCSDSQITLNWANGTYRFKQEAKRERFLILKQLMTRLNATTQWIRGHSGHEHNERCDKLANLGRANLPPLDTVEKVKKISKKDTSSVTLDVAIETEILYSLMDEALVEAGSDPILKAFNDRLKQKLVDNFGKLYSVKVRK